MWAKEEKLNNHCKMLEKNSFKENMHDERRELTGRKMTSLRQQLHKEQRRNESDRRRRILGKDGSYTSLIYKRKKTETQTPRWKIKQKSWIYCQKRLGQRYRKWNWKRQQDQTVKEGIKKQQKCLTEYMTLCAPIRKVIKARINKSLFSLPSINK